jgi:hypothetical protein
MATLLQSTNAFSGSGNLSVAVTITVNAGSLIVCYFGSPTTARTASVSDTLNGTYNSDSPLASSGGIFTFPNSAAGSTTITASLSGGATVLCAIFEEWSGVVTSTPFDQKASATGTAQTSGNTGTTPTLAQGNELCLGMICTNSNAGASYVATAPYSTSPSAPVQSGSNIFLCAGNQVQVATTGAQAGFSWTNSVNYRGAIATYKTLPVQNPTLGTFWASLP